MEWIPKVVLQKDKFPCFLIGAPLIECGASGRLVSLLGRCANLGSPEKRVYSTFGPLPGFFRLTQPRCFLLSVARKGVS